MCSYMGFEVGYHNEYSSREFFNFHQVAEDFDQYDKLVITKSFTFQPFYKSFYSAVNYNTHVHVGLLKKYWRNIVQ